MLTKHAAKNVRKTVENVAKTARFGWMSVEKIAKKFIDGTQIPGRNAAAMPRNS
jgi:hypothetical protein